MPVRQRGHRRSPRAADGTARSAAVATVERAGQAIFVRPPCEAALRPLATALHVAAVHATRGFLTVPWPVPLFDVEEMPWGRQAALPAGLEPVVVGLLERAGYSVVREGEPAAPLAAPAVGPGLSDRAVLDFVHATNRGVIRVGAGIRPEVRVAQLRLAFPDATIAVAAARREDVRRFGRALKALIPSACWSLGDDFPADPGPLVVSTYLGLADHGVALHRRDVLVCLDARESLGRRPTLAIGHADRARLYGLIGRDERLAPYDRDGLWALFGFDALDIPRHGHVARPVAVAFGKITGGTVPPGADVVALKRGGIWGNPIRNRRVARLAAAFADGEGPRLAAESPALAAHLAGVAAPGVVLLTEGIEHALGLAERLPGWGLLTGPHVERAGLTARQRDILDRRAGAGVGEPCGTIATLAGLSGALLERADVVVRADGGVGIPEALAASQAMPYGTGRPLLLVDFDDRHQPELRHRSRARRRAYLERGWSVDGTAGSMTTVDLFLATRPREGS